MGSRSVTSLMAAAMIATSISVVIAQDKTQGGQAVPRTREPKEQAEPKERSQPKERAQSPSDEPRRRPPDTERSGRARPRPDAPPPESARPRPSPPPRSDPPRYYGGPRVYSFPPVSLHRGFYYHPYFGFYYGPYYGPFYPYPGPHFRRLPYSTSAVRIRVRPVESEVYVNGYYAGIADDFDGVFQRLYVPAGHHAIELHLNGFQSYRKRVYVSPGDTLEITHQMEPLRPGESSEPVSPPQAPPREWMDTPPAMDQPASPFGILAIRVDPLDAQIFMDDEAWVPSEGRGELVMHMEAAWHQLEIRREGYQTFRTDIELSEGVTTRLNVKLVR